MFIKAHKDKSGCPIFISVSKIVTMERTIEEIQDDYTVVQFLDEGSFEFVKESPEELIGMMTHRE